MLKLILPHVNGTTIRVTFESKLTDDFCLYSFENAGFVSEPVKLTKADAYNAIQVFIELGWKTEGE